MEPKNLLERLERMIYIAHETNCILTKIATPDAEKILELLKEHELIIRCKDCKYGLYTGIEYLCDKHSGHANRFGEDQYYKEWHNGNWFCADGERRQEYTK